MDIPKKRRGGAYIMVLTVTMLILMLAVIAVSVTAVSRRITSRYSDYMGLFDLAVAGNEQALFLLNQADSSSTEAMLLRALTRAAANAVLVFNYTDEGFRLDEFFKERFHDAFNHEAMIDIRPRLGTIFTPMASEYRINWGLDSEIHLTDHIFIDSYRAITTVIPGVDRFLVSTRIFRYIDDVPGFPTVVGASIIWSSIGYREIVLDAHTITMLESFGAIFPTLPVPGMIIFLDEFMLTMVESLRIAD
ncbi:MAG: hypothetical protein FWE11_03440 [Defluviitaleaceae bacterium]|nr:hypothetical protein [Defluviitaleaceae bacterium]